MKTIAGLVLASGMSARFGGANKLLVPLAGAPILRRTVGAYLDADLDPVLVVLGHEMEVVARSLDDLPVTVVRNPDFRLGQSRALVHGLHALPPGCGAAVIGVGDQPLLTPGIIHGLVAIHSSEAAPLVVPRYAGRRGNPVLFDAVLFPELLAVEGDQGGRPVLQRHADKITWLDIPDPRPGLDLDTPDDLVALELALGDRE